jgi:hypothetical protein
MGIRSPVALAGRWLLSATSWSRMATCTGHGLMGLGLQHARRDQLHDLL